MPYLLADVAVPIESSAPAVPIPKPSARITAAALPPTDVRVYEHGVRLDAECVAAADEQIRKSRALDNEIIATMRRIYDEVQEWVLAQAGEDGRAIRAGVQDLNAQLAVSKLWCF